MKGKQPQGKAGHEERVPGGDQQEVEGTDVWLEGERREAGWPEEPKMAKMIVRHVH